MSFIDPQFLEALPLIVWTADSRGALDAYNRKWFDYTGLEPTDGWERACHTDDLLRVREQWMGSVETGQDYEIEYRLRRKDGVYRWHLGRAVRIGTGDRVRWFGTATDIEDQKRAQALAEHAVRLRDEFVSIASHELKTPLTSLRLQLQVIQIRARRGEQIGPPELLHKLDGVAEDIGRLDRLVDSMLDISRASEGRLQVVPEEVDLGALVQQVVGRFQVEAERAGTQIDVQVDRARGPLVRVDRVRLDHVVTNLLSNALKYGAGKPVFIRIHQPRVEGEPVYMQVVDQGIGIAPADQGRIFERFERAVSDRHYGGFGLGLWIVRQYLQAMGGQVTVHSAPGQGATFTVALPAA